jgi:hypothetical protein
LTGGFKDDQLSVIDGDNEAILDEKIGVKSMILTASSRRTFVGGSDARIIMGDDEEALLRLWREKRGEVEPKDLSGNLIVQLGIVTEDLNRRWYEANNGQVITDIQYVGRGGTNSRTVDNHRGRQMGRDHHPR